MNVWKDFNKDRISPEEFVAYIEIEAGGSEDYIPAGAEFEYTQDAMVLEELLDRIVAMGKAKQNKSEQTELTQFEENTEDE